MKIEIIVLHDQNRTKSVHFRTPASTDGFYNKLIINPLIRMKLTGTVIQPFILLLAMKHKIGPP